MSKKQLKTVIEMQDKFSKELKSFSDQLHSATDDLKKFQNEAQKGGQGSDALTGSLFNLSKVVKTVGIAYLGKKVLELGNFAINAASKMDELENVTSQVFGNSKKEIEDWAKTIDGEIGRSIYQLQNFASVYGSMFKGAGFDTSYFKNIAKDLSVFTADFSSFFNVTDDEAFTAIKGALTGETEALKRYGIILNDTVMSEYALAKGIKAKWSELDTATKMQLRYNKLMEMTDFIHGDASRTIDGYANSLKKAQGLIDNLATAIGQKMIPGATSVIHMFNGIAESIESMLTKKDATDYIFDFVTEKQSLDELYERYEELAQLYLQGLGTPESEQERLSIYERLKAMYPELISGIDKEARAYLEVGKAIDQVIGKLKQKILVQAKEDAVSRMISRAKKENDEIVKNNLALSEIQAKRSAKIGRDITGLISEKDIVNIAMTKDERKRDAKIRKILNGRGLYGKHITGELVKEVSTYSQEAFRTKGFNEDAARRRDMKMQEDMKQLEQQQKVLSESLDIMEKSAHGTNSIIKSGNNSVKSSTQTLNKLKTSVQHEKGSLDNTSKQTVKELTELQEKWDKGFYKNLKSKKEALKRMTELGLPVDERAKYLNEVNDLESSLKKKGSRSARQKMSKEEKFTYENYLYDVQKQRIFGDITGQKEVEQLKSKLSTIQSYMRGAIEKGNKELLHRLQEDFKETTFAINKINVTKGLEEVQKQFSKLDLRYKNGQVDDIGYHREKVSLLDKILEQYSENLIELPQKEKEMMEEQMKQWKESKEVSEKEVAEREHQIEVLKRTTEGLDALSSGFNGISAGISAMNINGSKTLGGISSVFGSLGSLSGGLKAVGGISKLGSIASTAASWGASLATVGSIATGVGAVVGVVGAVGSLLGKSGKKKAARIDAQNKENQEEYKKQVSAMQQLTQAIQQNSERVKTFADRVLTDVSKNPTLRYIRGGASNFDLLHDSMISGKHFNDISALETGSKKYRSGFRKKRKDTFTNVNIGEAQLLKYLGFDKTELDAFTAEELKQLDGALNQVNHEMLRRVTGRNLTESNIEEWKKQVHEFAQQIQFLEREKADLYKGSTLESFTGMEYRSQKELIKEYTEQFKQMGLVGEHYNQVIQDMSKNHQVLVTSMLDVRQSTIEGLASGKGGFVQSMKGYFEQIYKNASSVAYDVTFSDMDFYFKDMFETISNRLVGIKQSGKLNFSNLLDGFDFKQLKLAESLEEQTKKSLDGIKRQLLNSGVDLSLINKLLPYSEFNSRVQDISSSLSSAMSQGLEEHKFTSFTETLGKSLYDSTKGALVKAFSESSLYQGMIEKFIKAEDFQSQLEGAGSFKEAFGLAENIMKRFGYEMEAAGFGGFDAVNNLATPENQLGNAYYQDKASNVEVNVTNNFYGEVYGVDDFEGRILRTTENGIQNWLKRPRGDR